MSPRDTYITQIKNAINENKDIINIYGEKGIGKSYIISKLKQSLAKESENSTSIQYLCGTFDFNNYVGLSQDMTISALYDLCDFLVAKKTIALYQFNIVDRIDSNRNNRIPYSERKILASFDTSSEITNFVSDFVELPYVGAGIKMAKFATKIAMKYKPKSKDEMELYSYFDKLSDTKIKEQLPISLATDIEKSLQKNHNNIRLLIIIDNYNEMGNHNENTEWLDSLISNTNHNICWMFVSRNPMKSANNSIHIPITLMTNKEMEYLLRTEKYISDEDEINHCLKLCNGNPLHMERILEFIFQQRAKGSLDWSSLEKYSYEQIASETLKGLSTEQKEILFQLNFASAFNKELFCRLFPGRLFSIYQSWFDSSLFTKHKNGVYRVQNSMKEEITAFMNQLNPGLEKECYYNLFQAEYNWFKSHSELLDVTATDIGQHLQNFTCYGKKIKSIREYFEKLSEIKNILIQSGYTKSYLNELKQCVNSLNNSLKLVALKELATLSLYCSNYSDARSTIEEGVQLSKTLNDINSELEFASIQMNLEYIAPTNDANAVTSCIDIANRYIKTLENSIQNIPYKTYISNMVKVKLYLAKEYIIQKDYYNSETCLNYIFQLCNDPAKLNILSLHSSLAKAQEHMGEIYVEKKEVHLAIESYKKAVENYQIAEVLQPFWDSDFYLNFGLIHKRLAEEYFKLSIEDLEHNETFIHNALEHLDIALSKYTQVKERVPELIDTYCKTGFAYIAAADQLWKDNRWNRQVEQYLRDATNTLDQALEQIAMNSGEQSNGNRQIANSRCIISRINALYHERIGNYIDAERFFEQTLQDGKYAIQTAPNHPYGYMEAANGYLTYSSFLINQNQKEKAKEMILHGLRMIADADSFIDNTTGFIDIRHSLELNLQKCE